MLGLGLGLVSGAVIDNTFNPAAMVVDPSKALDISAQEGSVSGLQIKPDGTQFLISGVVSDDIFRYDGTSFANPSTGAVNTDVTDELSNNPTGLLYSADGTRMFVYMSNTAIERYNCTAYTPNTNSWGGSGQRLSIAATGITFGRGMCFNSDGTKLLVTGAGSQTIHYYDLSEAYAPHTATRDTDKELSVSSTISGTADMSCVRWLKNDTVIQVSDLTTDKIYHFDLATAGDPSTGVLNAAKTLDTASVDNAVFAFDWKPDGTALYVAGQQHDKVHAFFLT